MKNSLFALCLALLLTSCANVRVSHVDIASGAANPKAIYLRPFDASDCTFIDHDHASEQALRKSLAPAEFTEILKEEMEKMAPALVLKDGDIPTNGWLIEGSIDLVNTGKPGVRAIPGNLTRGGASHIRIHVRIIDLDAKSAVTSDEKESKDGSATETTAVKTRKGVVIYEFDVAGGSKSTGKFGSVTAPGLGYAPTFDYRNAAERIYDALSTDEFKFGMRDGPAFR